VGPNSFGQHCRFPPQESRHERHQPHHSRSLDQLETDLISLSSHINAMEYEFLVLLRELDLPQISTVFQKGDLSYSKARYLSRIATPSTEEHLLDFALKATAAQVDRHCMELRNVQRHTSTQDANRLHENRYLSCSPHSDGSVTLSVELPKETAALVMKTLAMAVPQLEAKDVYEGEEASAWGGHPSRGASMRTCRVKPQLKTC